MSTATNVPLDEGDPEQREAPRTLISRLGRWPLVIGALAWAASFAALFRTASFGLTLRETGASLLATLLLSAPVAPFAFVGLGWRRIVLGVLLVCSGGVLLAELFGRAQEILVVRRHGATPAERVLVERWWPFGNHSIVYTPEHGWSGTD